MKTKKLPSDFLKQGVIGTHVAADEEGNPVAPCSPRACKWCIIGAYHAAMGPRGDVVESDLDTQIAIMDSIETFLEHVYDRVGTYNTATRFAMERSAKDVIALVEEVEREMGWERESAVE